MVKRLIGIEATAVDLDCEEGNLPSKERVYFTVGSGFDEETGIPYTGLYPHADGVCMLEYRFDDKAFEEFVGQLTKRLEHQKQTEERE